MDQEEFYPLISYTDDVDLNEKLENCKRFIILTDHKAHLREKHLLRL
jgi:hypothetical protein